MKDGPKRTEVTGSPGENVQVQMRGVAVREALDWASCFFDDRAEQPRRAAEILLCEACGLRREEMYARQELPLTAEQWTLFRDWVRRHRDGEPLQYILGRVSFYDREFAVNRHVLIPRPETELLVEETLREVKNVWPSSPPLRVADIGTGSGVIAITLARLQPHWEVWAADCSDAALNVARENARRLGVEQQLHWLAGDFCRPLVEQGVRVDLLVSNPPYVSRLDLSTLAVGVREYEPRLALDGGEDGLEAYRRIIRDLPSVLLPDALVAFEVGIHQADAVCRMLVTAGFGDCKAKADLAGIPRFVFARWRSTDLSLTARGSRI